MFLRILAYCFLDAEERAEWHGLSMTLLDKTQWLFRRACIKEAVRYWIFQTQGELLFPSDIGVKCDGDGAFYVDGWWTGGASNTLRAPAIFLEGDRHSSLVTLAADADDRWDQDMPMEGTR